MNLKAKLAEQINAAPPELRDYIHTMETWDHSEAAIELQVLKMENRALSYFVKKFREQAAEFARALSSKKSGRGRS